MEFLRLSDDRFREFGPRIARLEHGITYPLGDDRFEIRHGSDYFAFFRRLGELEYFVAIERGEIVGVLAAVLRSMPSPAGTRSVWYLCDLKVFPGARSGTGKALLEAFDRSLVAGNRPSAAYAISMNTATGENRLERVISRWFTPPPVVASRLALYSLPADLMRRVAPTLSADLPLRYLSLAGIKDIVLASTGRPLPLLHVQFGNPEAQGVAEPCDGSTHMFCLIDSDVRNLELRRSRITPTATATIFVRSPLDVDFRCVRSSDI